MEMQTKELKNGRPYDGNLGFAGQKPFQPVVAELPTSSSLFSK
jgi:hypothetical protein